jgi:hypothetical protein
VQSPAYIRPFVAGIKKQLASLLEGRGTASEIGAIIRLAHAIAKASLARKAHLASLVNRHGLNYSDIAYDCVADLFARDENGKYIALVSYFSGFDFEKFTDEEAVFHIQRLVLTKAKHGVFRLYQQMDPQLGKILRNIKISVQALGQFLETERLGEACIVPSLTQTLEQLPQVEPEDIMSWLTQAATGSEFMPELLGKLSSLLRQQKEKSRIVPIVTVALGIRMFYEQKRLHQGAEQPASIDDITIDSKSVIKAACRELKMEAGRKYILKGKVTREQLDLYFEVIEQGLIDRFVINDGAGFELGEHFMKHVPGMTRDEYRKKHKNKIEYLARLAGERVVKRLRAE